MTFKNSTNAQCRDEGTKSSPMHINNVLSLFLASRFCFVVALKCPEVGVDSAAGRVLTLDCEVTARSEHEENTSTRSTKTPE